MSIVKGTQQSMFAFPAGQAASRGQLSGRSEWKGAEGRRKKKGPTIKKRKRVLFQALSYKHLEEGVGVGGGPLQTSEAWRGGRLSLTFPRSPSQKGCWRWHSSNISTASYHPAIHPTDLPTNHPPSLPHILAQAVTLEFLWGPAKYHPDRDKSKEMLLWPSPPKQTVQP